MMSKFKMFLKGYDATLKKFHAPSLAKATIICGYSSFFYNRFQIDLTEACRAKSLNIKRYENLSQLAESLDEQGGSNLFGESHLHLVKLKSWSASQAKILEAVLLNSQEIVMLLIEKPVTEKSLGAKIKELGCCVLETKDPWPSDLLDFIHWICEKLQLQLPRSLASLLSETLGSDLFKLENELRHLAMISADLNSLVDNHYLKDLSEKNSFWLQDLLAQKKPAALQRHLAQLIDQRESPLGLLAIIYRCYDAALGSARHSAFKKTIVNKVSSNPMTQRKYDLIANSYSESQLLSYYKNCQLADLKLKAGQEKSYFALCETLPQP